MYLKHARSRYGVTKPGSVGESIWIDQEGVVTGSRSEPNDVHLGNQIPATQPPLDPSAVPIQQRQDRILVSLPSRRMPGRHLDYGHQQHLFRQILFARDSHAPKYFIGDALPPAEPCRPRRDQRQGDPDAQVATSKTLSVHSARAGGVGD
jgi:hypothetical protein